MLSQDEKKWLVHGHVSIIQIALRTCAKEIKNPHLLTLIESAQESAKEIEGVVGP